MKTSAVDHTKFSLSSCVLAWQWRPSWPAALKSAADEDAPSEIARKVADQPTDAPATGAPDAVVVAAMPPQGVRRLAHRFDRDAARHALGRMRRGVVHRGRQPFVAINAGPLFRFNPSVSFIVSFDPARDPQAREHLDATWARLSEGGQALMPLDAYPFSPR